MRLADCISSKLLPLFMRRDDFNKTLCQCIDEIVKELYALSSSKLRFWDTFDNMTEEQLDECADEFGIYWYKYDANIEKKRSIVKCARQVKRKLGTVWAVEYVLSIYFDTSDVIEYWKYDGEKRHFKIQVYNSETVNQDAESFLKILNRIKRKAAILDYIEVMDVSTNEILYCITPSDASIEKMNTNGGK